VPNNGFASSTRHEERSKGYEAVNTLRKGQVRWVSGGGCAKTESIHRKAVRIEYLGLELPRTLLADLALSLKSCNTSISIIDTQSRTRIGDIPTGKGPVRIRVTPDGKTLVYALQTGEAVGFANAETGKEDTQVKLTGQPVSLTFSKDNQYAFSAVKSQDKVFVIRSNAENRKDHLHATRVWPGSLPYPSGRAPICIANASAKTAGRLALRGFTKDRELSIAHIAQVPCMWSGSPRSRRRSCVLPCRASCESRGSQRPSRTCCRQARPPFRRRPRWRRCFSGAAGHI